MGTNPHEMKARWDAMTAAWPEWRAYQRTMAARNGVRPPWEVMEWLCQLRAALVKGVRAFENHIAGGGLNIEVVGTCDCQTDIFDGPPSKDPLAWLHANHEVYNQAQIQLVEQTIGVGAFRKILERDLAFEDSDLGPEWGNLLRKDHTQSILDRLAA